MKNKDLYLIKQVITQVKDKGSNKFKLALIINEIELDKRIEALDKLREQGEDVKAFEQERIKIMQKYAEKDEAGNVLVFSEPDGKGVKKTDGYGFTFIKKDREAYEKELEKFQEENKELLEKELKKQKEFNKTLEQDVEPKIELTKIDFDIVPEIGFDQLKVLMPIINN